MECSDPGAIRDEEIVAYLAGEPVRPIVSAHLAHCQRCSSQLATYQQIEQKLTSALYRWDCPSSLELGEYQLGLLSATRTAELRAHMRSCVLCSAEVATLTDYLAHDLLLAERSAPVAPSRVQVSALSTNHHQPALDVKQMLGQLQEQVVSGARRIMASLVPPGPQVSFQRDIRAQAAQDVLWPRRYAAEDLSISLQVENVQAHLHATDAKGSYQLLGFVMRKGMPLESLHGTAVQLSAAAPAVAAIQSQELDELGNFVFSALVPATYTLELHVPEGIVVIDQIPISAQE